MGQSRNRGSVNSDSGKLTYFFSNFLCTGDVQTVAIIPDRGSHKIR